MIILSLIVFRSYLFADSKLTALSEDTTPVSTDIIYEVKNPGGTPVSKKVQIGNVLNVALSSTNTWTAPQTFTAPLTISGSSLSINGTSYTWNAASGGSGQFLQNNGGVITSATPSGGSGGSSSLAVSKNGVIISSPTAVVNFINQGINVSLTGGATAQVSLSSNTLAVSAGFSMNGNGSNIPIGNKGYTQINYDCSIASWTVVADSSGSVTIDIKRSSYSVFPITTSLIGGGTPLTLSSSQKNTSTPASWTSTTLNAGDILEFDVTASTITANVNVILKLIKT